MLSKTRIHDLIRLPLDFLLFCTGTYDATVLFVFSLHVSIYYLFSTLLAGVTRGVASLRGGGGRERDGRVESQLLGRALRRLQRRSLLGPQVSHARDSALRV